MTGKTIEALGELHHQVIGYMFQQEGQLGKTAFDLNRLIQFLRPRIMAQSTVQFIIGQLLTDEELREGFLDRPLETLASLRDIGLNLTSSEIIAIARTDRQLWRLGPAWIDLLLQQ